LGTRIVRSIYRAGSLRAVAEEILKYKLALVGLQGVRWDGGGIAPADEGREDIFKPTVWNESLHEISNDTTIFPHLNIHQFIWTSPDGKIHNQTDHIVIDRRRHSSILDVRSFRAADCVTDHYLVVAKVRERLAVSKQRRKTSRHFRNKKREYLKDKIDELAVNSKNKNIRDPYRGINDFKMGYQPSSNLGKDENVDLLADSHNILNTWRNYFSQLLNVRRVSD
ncbi:hypothetical protein B7P43_G00585, partial [Cryptotermes secundus]